MTITTDSQAQRDALISAAFLLKWLSADLRKTAHRLAGAAELA